MKNESTIIAGVVGIIAGVLGIGAAIAVLISSKKSEIYWR